MYFLDKGKFRFWGKNDPSFFSPLLLTLELSFFLGNFSFKVKSLCSKHFVCTESIFKKLFVECFYLTPVMDYEVFFKGVVLEVKPS